MTLHIFGDSFSIPSHLYSESTLITWTDYLSEFIYAEKINNCAQEGVANDYIFNCLIEQSRGFKSGDVVIIQTTNCERQWFFKSKPELSNIYLKDLEKHIDQNEMEAVRKYIQYLNTTHLNNIRNTMFYFAIQYMQSNHPSVKFCILPGWDNIPNVNGNLIGISDNEFISETAKIKWYQNHKSDPRPNHMLHKINHKILAKKIYDFLFEGISLDLQNNFETKFID